jgi:hypothetical protein
MQVVVLPAHDDLDDAVQAAQTGVTRNLYAPPDGGLYMVKGDFDLIYVHGRIQLLPVKWIVVRVHGKDPPASAFFPGQEKIAQ